MARRACDLTGHQDWSCLSTLAAAYAEAGDMEQAANWAKQSKQIAPDDQKDELEKLVKTYEGRQARQRKTSTAVRGGKTERQ